MSEEVKKLSPEELALRATSICLGTNPNDFVKKEYKANWDGIVNQKDKTGKPARSRSPSPAAAKRSMSPKPRTKPAPTDGSMSEMKIRYTDPETRLNKEEPEE